MGSVKLIRRHDGKFPWTYLGKPIDEILEPLDMTVDEFVKVCDRFTNKKLFQVDARGNLAKRQTRQPHENQASG